MSRTGGRCDRTVRSRGARLARVAVVSLLLWGGITGTMVLAPGAATAQSADGTLTVQVLRDFFGTGVINATMDVPQRGMVVTITDPAGQFVRAVTDATGKVILAPSRRLAGGQYRVDVSIPAPYDDYLRPAPAATKAAHDADHFDSFVSHVDLRGGTDTSVITGVWNPVEYATPDSRYFVPVQSPTIQANGSAADPNDRALVSFPQNARGTCDGDFACPTPLNTQAQVGTTWGLVYDKYRGRLLQSAFARRYTDFGPGGGGAIYSTPTDGSGQVRLFGTVPGTTLTPHGPVDMRKDPLYVDVPGKEGLGGLAMTEDGKTLYAVNLLTRQLVSFDATGSSATVRGSVRIPDPGCAAPTDWRPFAVAAHDAKLYVGGVCSAESTQNRADLKAVVYTYDGSAFTPVVTHSLDFLRGFVVAGRSGDTTAHWNPWSADVANWDRYNQNGPFINPEPELASLAFSRNGSMILGFRDRFMDIVGSGGLDPRPGNGTAETGMSGGDITMACATGRGGFEWEGTGACPNHGTAANNGQEPDGVVEYFPGDFFDPQRTGQASHGEAAQGSVAYIPQQQYVLSTQLDPARNVNADGVGFYDVDTGLGPGQNNPDNGYEFVSDGRDNGFAKAGGLGDVAYQAENAPIQIGNIVWFDGDHNGVQDPYRRNEVPLAGATVSLRDADGTQVASTRTDAAGEYYFGGVGADYTLTRAAKYTVRFDTCTAETGNVPTQPPATELRFTLPLAGRDRGHDSNVVPPRTGPLCAGDAPVTAPAAAGGVNHTIDAGVYLPQPKSPGGGGGVPVHTGGAALAGQSGDDGANWWWLALSGLGVLLGVGAGVRLVRARHDG